VRLTTTLACLLCLCGAAKADWKIESLKDGSGREAKRGTVTARAQDATLQLDCANGAQLLSINVDRDFSRGMIGSVVTFDERKPRSQLLQVFSDPRSIPLFDISIRDVVRAKRLRLELQPIEGLPTSYDFDTGGGKKAFKAVVCGAKSKSLFRKLRF
jgi:hypothetical protein